MLRGLGETLFGLSDAYDAFWASIMPAPNGLNILVLGVAALLIVTAFFVVERAASTAYTWLLRPPLLLALLLVLLPTATHMLRTQTLAYLSAPVFITPPPPLLPAPIPDLQPDCQKDPYQAQCL